MESLIKQVDSLLKDLLDAVFPRKECSQEDNLESFRETLVSVAKLISHDVTKITILFSGPPYPDETTIVSLATPLVSRLQILVVTFQQIPRVAGKTLNERVSLAVQKIVASAVSFLHLVRSFQGSPRDGGMQLLQTSQIWEACDQVANIPLIPGDCVREEIGKQTALVTDAMEELSSAMTEEPSSENGESDEEEHEFHGAYSLRHRELLPYCVALVKAAVGLLKKISTAVKRSARHSKVEEVDELDKVLDSCNGLSPFVDDFVMAVEPPLELGQVKEEAENLVKKQRDLLDLVRRCHFVTEDDQKWIEVLTKALDHNLRKIEENPGVA